MSGYLVTSTWDHLALSGFWAAVLTITLLVVRRWLGTTPAAAAVHSKRRPHRMAHRAGRRHTFDSRQQRRG